MNPELPPRLEAIIDKTLEKDRELRCQSAAELRADLKRLKREIDSGKSATFSSTGVIPSGARDLSSISAPAEPITVTEVTPARASRRPYKLIAAGIVILIMIAAVFLAARYLVPVRAQTVHSVAVLPFTGSSGNPDAEFLQDGISIGVTDALSQLPGLKVMSSSAAMRYAGKNPDPQKVGGDLKVDAVLVGKIEQQGGTISVNAELVNTADDSQIWGEQYTEKIANVAMVQQEIVRDISDKLRMKLSPAQKQQMTQRPMENADAYRFYVLGEHEWTEFSPESLPKAIDYFQQAIDKDPKYAAAYAGLSQAYGAFSVGGGPRAGELLKKARTAANQAIALDDLSAEGHSALADIERNEWQFAAAESEYRRALELNPNLVAAHVSYGVLLASLGRLDEALEQERRALELDPLDTLAAVWVGQIYYFQRDYDKAIVQVQKALEINANYQVAYVVLFNCYREKGMDEKAADTRKRIVTISGQTQLAAGIRQVFANSGLKGVLRNEIEARSNAASPAYGPLVVAQDYSALGDKDKSFEWLNKAYDARQILLMNLRVDPVYDPLRSDPRYADLVRRIGFPQ